MFRALVRHVLLIVILVVGFSAVVGTGVPAIDEPVDDGLSTIEPYVEEYLPDDPSTIDPNGESGTGPGGASIEHANLTDRTHTDREDAIARAVHRQINEIRVDHDLSRLEYDERLEAVARYHSDDMAVREYFAHTGPDGQEVTDRYDQFDYDCQVAVDAFRYATGGENIYMSQGVRQRSTDRIATEAVDGWMNSTSHRKNILRPYWNREGIGVNVTESAGTTTVYVTQNFC